MRHCCQANSGTVPVVVSDVSLSLNVFALLVTARLLAFLICRSVLILKWAAKSYERGHLSKVGCQPSSEKVIKNLYQRYNMNKIDSKGEAIVSALLQEDSFDGLL
jgi:hypothetical protein